MRFDPGSGLFVCDNCGNWEDPKDLSQGSGSQAGKPSQADQSSQAGKPSQTGQSSQDGKPSQAGQPSAASKKEEEEVGFEAAPSDLSGLDMNELLEHADYVSNSYGTPRAFVEKMLAEGMNVLLDIEVQGARQVHKKMPEAVTIFIAPPSLEVLERRLRGRGTDTEEAIAGRLERARQEFRADRADWLKNQ